MRFAEVGGMLKPIVDLPIASAFSLTDQTILISEGQTFQPFAPLSAVFNAVAATYPAKVEKWTSKDAPEYIDPAALEADGGRYLPTSLSFGAVPYHTQVRRLIRSQLRDYRRERRHEITLPPGGMILEPAIDMISWTSARNGYAAKKFVVEQVAKSMSLNVLVALREVDPGDYDWTSSWQVPVSEIPPAPVVPWTQAIAGFTVTPTTVSNTAGQVRPALLASCTGGEAGVSAIHMQVRRLGQTDTDQDFTAPYLSPWTWRITDLLPATAYQVRARLLSDRTPKSQWTAWINVTTSADRLEAIDIAGGALYVEDEYTTSDVLVTSVNNYQDPLLIISQEVNGFDLGGFSAVFQCFMDNTHTYDSFGTLILKFDGDEVARQRFGVRTSGGETEIIMPVMISSASSGVGEALVEIYAHNSSWTGEEGTANSLYLRNCKLVVAGSKR